MGSCVGCSRRPDILSINQPVNQSLKIDLKLSQMFFARNSTPLNGYNERERERKGVTDWGHLKRAYNVSFNNHRSCPSYKGSKQNKHSKE